MYMQHKVTDNRQQRQGRNNDNLKLLYSSGKFNKKVQNSTASKNVR